MLVTHWESDGSHLLGHVREDGRSRCARPAPPRPRLPCPKSPMDAIGLRSRVSFSERQELTGYRIRRLVFLGRCWWAFGGHGAQDTRNSSRPETRNNDAPAAHTRIRGVRLPPRSG